MTKEADMATLDYHKAAERLKRLEREGGENKKQPPKEKFFFREGEVREVEVPSLPQEQACCS